MNNQKVKEIVKFSIKQNIQNKWFVIFNILIFALIVIMANASNINKFLENNNVNLFNDDITIEYIDNDNILEDRIQKVFEGNEKVTVKEAYQNVYTAENIPDNVIVLEVRKSSVDIVQATMTSKEGVEGAVYEAIENELKEIRVEQLAKETQTSKSKLELLNEDVEIKRVMLGVDAENSEKKESILFISTIIVYMMSIFIFSKIANDIANEKVSKSIEYVLTSVTEKEYLLAKIISIILIVLLQGVFALTYYMIGNLINSSILMANGIFTTENIGEVMAVTLDKDIIWYICLVFVYSLLTIVLLSIIQAALSSKTTSMSEAGNSMTFLMVITISVYVLTFALINPYTNMTIAMYLLSCIPLISNYFIPAIMIIGQAKAWQIVLSLVLLIVSIPVTFNYCSKVFKNGVLDYSNKKKKNRKPKKVLSLKEEQNLRVEKSKFRSLALVIGMTLILVFVLQVISQVLCSTLISSLGEGVLTKSQIKYITTAINSIISLCIPYAFMSLYIKNNGNNKKSTNSKENWKTVAGAIFFIGLVQIGLILAQMYLGVENEAVRNILEVEGLENFGLQILYVFTIAVIPGILEELLYRKGLIDLTRGYGEKFAILFSAIIFGLAHMNFTQTIFAFLMGLALGTVYVKTGNIKYTMLLHILNNAYAAFSVIITTVGTVVAYKAMEYIVLAIIILCGIIFVLDMIKKIKAKEKLITIEGKVIPTNLKYIFTDYTFIVGVILTVMAFIVTEQTLKLL